MSPAAPRRADDPNGSQAASPDLTEDFSCTCLLLLLDERPATETELCDRLKRLGLVEQDADPARIDAILQLLAEDGLVQSDAPRSPTAARVYRLTAAGADRLGIAADDLRSTQVLLDRFLARCGERIVL